MTVVAVDGGHAVGVWMLDRPNSTTSPVRGANVFCFGSFRTGVRLHGAGGRASVAGSA